MKPSVWVITNGTPGNLIQAKGIAEKLNGNVDYYQLPITLYERYFFMYPMSFSPTIAKKLPKQPPPDVVVGCGRHSIPYLLKLKRLYKNTVKTIYILDPRISSKNFDLVIAKTMDRAKGDNVIHSFGSLNTLNKDKLSSAANNLKDNLNLKPPYLFIAIGGSQTSSYPFTRKRCHLLIQKLEAIVESYPGSVLITPTRRTGVKNIKLLSFHLSKNNKVFFDENQSSSVYHGMLGLADCCLISSDSINMLTEACVRNTPVYHYRLPRFIHSIKIKKFIRELEDKEYIKPFTGTFAPWKKSTLNESKRISQQALSFLNL